jgi:hypothetical protein
MSERAIFGLDPGKNQDPAALAVVKAVWPEPVHPHELAPDDRRSLEEIRHPRPQPSYWVMFLDRWTLGTGHDIVANDVLRQYQHPALPHAKTLLIDAGGVGDALADMLKMRHVRPIRIWWVNGLRPNRHGEGWVVPKRQLVERLLVLTQQRNPRRLHFAAQVEPPFLAALIAEMVDYCRRPSPSGLYETFAAPTGKHDDLISALLMAVWHPEHVGSQQARMVPYSI